MLTDAPLFYQLPIAETPPAPAAFSIPVYSAAPSGEDNWHHLPAYSPLPVGTYLSRPNATGVRYLTPKKGLPAAQLASLHTHLQQALTQAPVAGQVATTEESTPELSQCSALGFGFDFAGELNTTSFLHPLVQFTWDTDFTMSNGDQVLIPDGVVGIVNTSSSSEADTYESREQWQQALTASVGIAGHYEAFSGEFNASFTTTNSGSESHSYTSIEQTASIANFSLLTPTTEVLNQNFLSAYQSLPESVNDDNAQDFIDFFSTYGVFYVQAIEVGASATISVTTQKSDVLSTTDMQTNVQAQVGAIFGGVAISASVSDSEAWQAYVDNSTVKTNLQGGSSGLQLAFNQDLTTPFNPPDTTKADYDAWAASVDEAPAIVQYTFGNVWDLLPNQAPNVEEAWNNYGAKLFPVLRLGLSSTYAPSSVVLAENPLPPELVLAGDNLASSDSFNLLAGVQVVIIRNYTTQPASASVQLNSYYGTNTFNDTSWWDACATAIEEVIQTDDILLLATYNCTPGLAPTYAQQICTLLTNVGASDASMLREWQEQSGDDDVTIQGLPICYFCVGVYGNPTNPFIDHYDVGYETIGISAAITFFFDPSSRSISMDLMTLTKSTS